MVVWPPMSTVDALLSGLSETYTALHTAKEDLFWSSKMGLTDDSEGTQRALAEAEIALNRFLQDPARLAALRARVGEGTSAQQRVITGWIAVFAANTIESPEARALSEAIVQREGELQRARGGMKLGFTDPATGVWEEASSNKLALVLRNDPDEARRKAAHAALASVEDYVLGKGFLDIVRMRNALGRMLGYEDYYAWRVAMVERMDKRALFGTLDDLARRTAERTTDELKAFESLHGEGSLTPWNFLFHRAGKLAAALDPYFAFGRSLRHWGESFSAMGVRFRGATLTLDLVDRAGKYENGFMHGPGVAFYDHGTWRPARINFTANAVLGAVGSGLRATETLFHEGGHAAHFSNILSDAPCFAQEFAPTSVAYAETQSMFMDSLLDDADWRQRYLTDARGERIPTALLESSVRESQPLKAWDQRAMLTIPMAERAMYETPDNELTPERVLRDFRRIERDLQGLTAGVRPVLAVPHLLSGEASAYYHGYVLAEMAVHQTREHFLRRDGHLVDNPKIGPELAEKYWAPGNAVSFDDTVRALTGTGLRADALVDACNLTTDEALTRARASLAREPGIARATGGVQLDVNVRVMHGRETIATTDDGGFDGACKAFEAWGARG